MEERRLVKRLPQVRGDGCSDKAVVVKRKRGWQNRDMCGSQKENLLMAWTWRWEKGNNQEWLPDFWLGSLSGWKAIYWNRDTKKRLRFLRLWRNQEFSFGHVKCEMPVKHLNGDAKWEASLESRDMIWAGHSNWRVIDISMEFQVWGTWIRGEDKRF